MYWIDTSVLIEAAHGPYPPETFPNVWAFFSDQLARGEIGAPKLVYDELTSGNDWLSNWCKQRKSTLALRSPRAAQQNVRSILDSLHASRKHTQPQVVEFSRGADSWVIANAMIKHETVVTMETERTGGKIKIPTVCRMVGVEQIELFELLRRLDFRRYRPT